MIEHQEQINNKYDIFRLCLKVKVFQKFLSYWSVFIVLKVTDKIGDVKIGGLGFPKVKATVQLKQPALLLISRPLLNYCPYKNISLLLRIVIATNL